MVRDWLWPLAMECAERLETMASISIYRDMPAPSMRPRTRREKVGIALSLIGFFGAIIALVIYAISGYHASTPVEEDRPFVIFAGGEPADVADTDPVSDDDTAAYEDDEEGSFGQPADELYADDDAGGWSTSAIESSSGQGSSSDGPRSNPRRQGRISRGTGGAS